MACNAADWPKVQSYKHSKIVIFESIDILKQISSQYDNRLANNDLKILSRLGAGDPLKLLSNYSSSWEFEKLFLLSETICIVNNAKNINYLVVRLRLIRELKISR